jgi:hypothetical protein
MRVKSYIKIYKPKVLGKNVVISMLPNTLSWPLYFMPMEVFLYVIIGFNFDMYYNASFDLFKWTMVVNNLTVWRERRTWGTPLEFDCSIF